MNTTRSIFASILCVLLVTCGLMAQKVPGGACALTASMASLPTNTPLAAPTASTVTPTGGTASTWTYKLVAKTATGSTALGAASTTTAGAATLDATHYNTITVAAVTGETDGFDIYRTAVGTAPTTTGKIGVVAHGVTTFKDDGLAGDGATGPAADTTGLVQLIAKPNVTTPLYNGAALVTGVQVRSIHLCNSSIKVVQGSAAANYALVAGTGTNCNTGTTYLTPLFTGVASVTEWLTQHLGADSAIVVPAGNAVCLKIDKVPTAANVFLNYGFGTR